MGCRYSCPRCEVVLNPTKEIVLSGRKGADRGLFMFHPDPGNYEYHTSPGIEVAPGDLWEFCCPTCQHDLTTPYSGSLAQLRMVDEKGDNHLVIFSKVAGQHATFDVTEEKVQSFGEHLQAYIELSIRQHYW